MDDFRTQGRKIIFVSEYKEPVDKYINTLTQFNTIEFSDTPTLSEFNHPIPYLPPSITHLILGKRFSQRIRFPPKLTFVKFGDDFNEIVDFSTCPELKCLIFGKSFNQPIDLTGLNNLCWVSIGANYSARVDPSMFLNISYLNIGSYDVTSTSTSTECTNKQFFIDLLEYLQVNSSCLKKIILSPSVVADLNKFVLPDFSSDPNIDSLTDALKSVKISKY